MTCQDSPRILVLPAPRFIVTEVAAHAGVAMNSELIKILLENADRLGAADLVIVVVLVGALVTSAVTVIHWIYKHAFEKQGEVVKSQGKLIEIKNLAIADYEKSLIGLSTERLAEQEQRVRISHQLQETQKQLQELSSGGREREADLLMFAATNLAARLVAQLAGADLRICQVLKRLSLTYEAARQQHGTTSGPSLSTLIERIVQVESVHLERLESLKALHQFTIDGARNRGLPALLLEEAHGKRHEKVLVDELKRYVFDSTIPILREIEPEFAARMHDSFEATPDIPVRKPT